MTGLESTVLGVRSCRRCREVKAEGFGRPSPDGLDVVIS
jgi:hypothetical protein